MARTGLRMMPTFPSPSLKFRTVGFPQYGFKASMSDSACRPPAPVKPVPGIPGARERLQLPFARAGHRGTPGAASRTAGAAAGRCARGPASLPQGSLAPVRVLLSRSLLAYSDPIRQSPRHAATSRLGRLYAAPSLCGHASATGETFPPFAAVLSSRAVAPTPAGPRRLSRYSARRDTRLPRFLTESPPASARLCQQSPTGDLISALHHSRYAAARGFAEPSWLATTGGSPGGSPRPAEVPLSLPLLAPSVTGRHWESG